MISKNKQLAIAFTILPFLLFGFGLMLSIADDWETLVGGAMSVAAAIWAGLLLLRQINQTETHERDRLRRKYIAARATLPLALTQIIEYCENACRNLKALYGRGLLRSEVGFHGFDPGTIPESVLSNISTMIENTPHDNVAERLSELVAMIQIFQSRMRRVASGNLNREDIGAYLINCGMLYASASSLYGYSRDKAVFHKAHVLAPVMFDRVESAFNALSLHGERYHPIRERVARRMEANEEVNLDSFN